jgi:hypothetical protein
MGTQDLYKTKNEKDVENLYRHIFSTKLKDMSITSPYNCDGFGVCKITNSKESIRVLMEYKHDKNLKNRVELCKVIAQSIFYVKKFYLNGVKPPSTIFIADKDECLVLHVNDIIDYLDLDLEWSKAASSASDNTELLTKLIEDKNINPFVFDSDHFDDCLEKIKELTGNVQRKVLITDKNITEVFRYFEKTVLGDKCKLNTNEKANLFVQLLVNKDENYLHPVKRRKVIMTKSFGEIPIPNRDSFISFFGHFSSSYSPKQKEKLTAIVDRIVEDTTRRKQGEFFTPTIWVDKAHEYITSVYGKNWKDEYVVWDPAWGTGNLTRDYKFKELYVSTLNQSDIDTAEQMGYNPESTKFQYDFLNDDYEKLPESLRKTIEEGRKIIVLMNPPYATSNDLDNTKSNETLSKKGVSQTKVGLAMKYNKLGGCSDQLYAQFMYRIMTEFKGMNICLFSPPLYLTGLSYKKFREEFNIENKFMSGYLMDSKNFADVSSWGLSFSILSCEK